MNNIEKRLGFTKKVNESGRFWQSEQMTFLEETARLVGAFVDTYLLNNDEYVFFGKRMSNNAVIVNSQKEDIFLLKEQFALFMKIVGLRSENEEGYQELIHSWSEIQEISIKKEN